VADHDERPAVDADMGRDTRRVGRRNRQRRQVVDSDHRDAGVAGVAPAHDRQANRARRRVAVGSQHPVAPASLHDERGARRAGQPARRCDDTASNNLW
jgi:hypothetical protein